MSLLAKPAWPKNGTVLQDEWTLWEPGYLNGHFSTLRQRQDGCHFPDDIFRHIFLNENAWILNNILLKFVPKGPINNIPALVQIMAWRCQVTSHCLNQWWLVYWGIYASVSLNELSKVGLSVKTYFKSLIDKQTSKKICLTLQLTLPPDGLMLLSAKISAVMCVEKTLEVSTDWILDEMANISQNFFQNDCL